VGRDDQDQELGGNVVEQQASQKHKQQDQDDRRDVDPAEVREKRADRAKRRLGQSPQHIADHGYDLVVSIDNAESQEPAQHGLGDEQPNIDSDQRIDKP